MTTSPPPSPPPIDLKQTVHLPHTTFPIRAELAVTEPQWLARCEAHQWAMATRGPDAPRFVLHDGPPYPNGNIHLGHALNKVLKDIMVRSKRMMGYQPHYVPGWDCHGLPIETQVLKETKQRAASIDDIPAFRRQCQAFAHRYVQTQATDFKRLGIWGDWDRPYLTLTPDYEAAVVRLFGELAHHGAIYKGRKPIHWCMSCETALAEAEIEYDHHQSPAVYVRFPMVSGPSLDSGAGGAGVLVWTTTPWTLPANVALAVNPGLSYVLLPAPNGPLWVAETRVADLASWWGDQPAVPLARCQGEQLLGCVVEHPFEERQVPIIGAGFVTDTDGSGVVHIAPGHGQDDHMVGLRHQLPVRMPIDSKGRFENGHQWEGMHVFKANDAIIALLESRGRLVHSGPITHSYPHCWRCKQPVIFRATPQWFVAMDTPLSPDGRTLRDRTLAAIDATDFYPSWGKNRIRAMVEGRPDWCISRQRHWGIPIPVVTCQTCGHSETVRFNEAIASKVAIEGSTAWFERPIEAWLPPDATCEKCGGTQFEKERDILDVWFESGASFASVLSDIGVPADLILEGSDQHRGWFQSGLLLGQGARQLSPSRAILTHGFIVDDQGKKMSKSLGNVMSPDTIIKEYGADILRWWVASSDFKTDSSISKNILNQARDAFAKVRNTIRFLLANMAPPDGDPAPPSHGVCEEVDRWVLHELSELVLAVRQAYTEYETHVVTHRVHDFCAVTLSSWYLDIVKDRLYCDAADSPRRRSAQVTMAILARQLAQLIAPILVVTSDAVYQHLGAKPHESIHLTDCPTPEYLNPVLADKWRRLLVVKDLAYQQLERLRQEKVIKRFLDAKVAIESPDPLQVDDLASVFIVSEATWVAGPQLTVHVTVAEGEKCERCWKIKPVYEVPNTPHRVCDRCREVLGGMGIGGGAA